MRFSAIAAFVLPLSALAAPSLVERQSALDAARQQVVDGLTNAGAALNATLAQAAAITRPPQQAVIADATKAQGDIALAGAAVERIGAAILAATPPQESDQLAVAQGILGAQDIINQLEGEIVGHHKGDRSGKGQGQGQGKGKGLGKNREAIANQLNDLRTSIGQARDGISLALQGGISVLAQQGKSIKQLFEDAKLPVPPGF